LEEVGVDGRTKLKGVLRKKDGRTFIGLVPLRKSKKSGFYENCYESASPIECRIPLPPPPAEKSVASALWNHLFM
jgi:hypothetical protein